MSSGSAVSSGSSTLTPLLRLDPKLKIPRRSFTLEPSSVPGSYHPSSSTGCTALRTRWIVTAIPSGMNQAAYRRNSTKITPTFRNTSRKLGSCTLTKTTMSAITMRLVPSSGRRLNLNHGKTTFSLSRVSGRRPRSTKGLVWSRKKIKLR